VPHEPLAQTFNTCNKIRYKAEMTSTPLLLRMRAEMVSPVLGYDDIPQLQEVVRAIRRAGGKINSQCGIHIHIDAAPFDGRHLGNLAKIVYKQEPLILHALGISRDRTEALLQTSMPVARPRGSCLTWPSCGRCTCSACCGRLPHR